MPLTRRSRGRIAAPTISGPAHAPRPTSSMPTTTSWPRSHISRSTDRVGARFLDTRPTVAVTPPLAFFGRFGAIRDTWNR